MVKSIGEIIDRILEPYPRRRNAKMRVYPLVKNVIRNLETELRKTERSQRLAAIEAYALGLDHSFLYSKMRLPMPVDQDYVSFYVKGFKDAMEYGSLQIPIVRPGFTQLTHDLKRKYLPCSWISRSTGTWIRLP